MRICLWVRVRVRVTLAVSVKVTQKDAWRLVRVSGEVEGVAISGGAYGQTGSGKTHTMGSYNNRDGQQVLASVCVVVMVMVCASVRVRVQVARKRSWRFVRVSGGVEAM